MFYFVFLALFVTMILSLSFPYGNEQQYLKTYIEILDIYNVEYINGLYHTTCEAKTIYGLCDYYIYKSNNYEKSNMYGNDNCVVNTMAGYYDELTEKCFDIHEKSYIDDYVFFTYVMFFVFYATFVYMKMARLIIYVK